MRKRYTVIGAVLVVGLAGCARGSSNDQKGHAPQDSIPSVASFVGQTKEDTQAALGGTGTAFGFQDLETNDRSGSEYDSWVVCKQDASNGPIWFTVAASQDACGLLPTPSHKDSPATASQPDSSDAGSDQDSNYASAVKAQVPKLVPVADDDLGAQGRSICGLLDSGDSPKSVLEIMQAAYPGEAGRIMVIEAPSNYCSKHASAVERALR